MQANYARVGSCSICGGSPVYDAPILVIPLSAEVAWGGQYIKYEGHLLKIVRRNSAYYCLAPMCDSQYNYCRSCFEFYAQRYIDLCTNKPQVRA
jgi:hypothetical protein